MGAAHLMLIAAGLVFSGSAAADLRIAGKEGCLACHALDQQVVGPAWRDVAARNKGDAGAQARLEKKIRNGGRGKPGEIVQPPNKTISDADLKALVKFILAL